MVKAVTLVEDVYRPPNGTEDPERCLIIAYVIEIFIRQKLMR